MDNKKEKISNLELLEAMSGINEKYLKEADSLCIKKKNYFYIFNVSCHQNRKSASYSWC